MDRQTLPNAGPTAAPAKTAAWLVPNTRARLDALDISANNACAPAMYTALPAPATKGRPTCHPFVYVRCST